MKNLQIKIDKFLWAFIWVVPFFAFWVSWSEVGGAPNVLTFLETYEWSFVSDIINQVWQLAFNTNCPLASLLSYLVAVEVSHIMFDVIVFIPRFAHAVVERGVSLWQKD